VPSLKEVQKAIQEAATVDPNAPKALANTSLATGPPALSSTSQSTGIKFQGKAVHKIAPLQISGLKGAPTNQSPPSSSQASSRSARMRAIACHHAALAQLYDEEATELEKDGK
jgi:hypothetical protein